MLLTNNIEINKATESMFLSATISVSRQDKSFDIYAQYLLNETGEVFYAFLDCGTGQLFLTDNLELIPMWIRQNLAQESYRRLHRNRF